MTRLTSTRIHSTRILQFQKIVLDHYKKNGRHDLPWRAVSRIDDPYAIAVSEVMLQQTQAARVAGKYLAFMKRFPTVRALAKAPLSAVLAEWSGLGYNRRAKFLHQMAQSIVLLYKGVFPRTAMQLETLPGIGHYTARAICAFAYNQPEAFIETNIRTVFIHHFFADAALDSPISDLQLLPLVEATVDMKNPRRWYAALMDYGASLKQSGNTVHRQSRQYVKQSTFKGSGRQLRGAIIRSLVASPKSVVQLVRETERPQPEVVATLETLMREDLLLKQGARYTLAQ